MSAVVLAISTYILGYEPANIWAFLAAIILSIILYTAAVKIGGLFSKTVLEASLSILPVAFIFTGAPWGALFVKDYPVFKVLDYMPSSQLVHLLEIPHTGYTTGDLLKPLLITLAWTVVLTVVSVILYQRRLKDEQGSSEGTLASLRWVFRMVETSGRLRLYDDYCPIEAVMLS